MVKRKVNRDGYSLVELLIASAISAVVLGGLITLLAFGTSNMNRTQTRVALQNQAKDAIRHMSTYVMEADDTKWDDTKKMLTVIKNKVKEDDTVEETEKCFYWRSGEGIYFGKESAGVNPDGTLPSDTKHLLVDKITDFQCKVEKDGKTGKKIVHLSMKLEDDSAKFECDQDVSMRNQ